MSLRTKALWLLGLSLAAVAGPQTAVAGEWTISQCTECHLLGELGETCCSNGPVCGDCCSCAARWSATAEYLWLGRSRGDQQTLFNADVGGVLFRVMDVSDLVFDVESGVRMELTRQIAFGREIEFAYYGVFHQTARQTINIDPLTPNLNSVTYDFFGVTGGNATAYTAEYHSNLHSGEANLRLNRHWGFLPLVGFRFLQLDEELELYETVTPADGALGEMRNNLAGAQLGLERTLWNRGDWFRVEAAVKGGVLYNRMNMHADVHTGGVPTMSLDRRFQRTATLGEVAVTLVWQITRWTSLRAGYSGLWLNDVALIADQSDDFDLATSAGTLQASSASFHGGRLGLEFIW